MKLNLNNNLISKHEAHTLLIRLTPTMPIHSEQRVQSMCHAIYSHKPRIDTHAKCAAPSDRVGRQCATYTLVCGNRI